MAMVECLSAVICHDRRSRVTPQIISTADEEHEKTSGERQRDSPTCRSHDRTVDSNFKTRCQPCRIPVRAAIEKCEQFGKNRPRFGANCTSHGAELCRIPAFGLRHLRFTDDCQLKTASSQRRCELRFPYAACRCNTTGLLEQMP